MSPNLTLCRLSIRYELNIKIDSSEVPIKTIYSDICYIMSYRVEIFFEIQHNQCKIFTGRHLAASVWCRFLMNGKNLNNIVLVILAYMRIFIWVFTSKNCFSILHSICAKSLHCGEITNFRRSHHCVEYLPHFEF